MKKTILSIALVLPMLMSSCTKETTNTNDNPVKSLSSATEGEDDEERIKIRPTVTMNEQPLAGVYVEISKDQFLASDVTNTTGQALILAEEIGEYTIALYYEGDTLHSEQVMLTETETSLVYNF